MPHEPNGGTDSSKEVAGQNGIEVLQPGLIPVFHPAQNNLSHDTGKSYEPAPLEKKIWGLRKVTFWLVLALVALTVVIVGVAVGLGVAMSRARSSEPQPTQAAPAETVLGTPDKPSTTSATTSISSTASSTSSTSSPTASSICPDANNTIVTQGVGNTKYRILCDSDFTGSGKKTLSSINLPSFDECLTLCNTMNYFQERGDVGCTYNAGGTGGQSPGTCWCLGGADKKIFENVGNDAAVPL